MRIRTFLLPLLGLLLAAAPVPALAQGASPPDPLAALLGGAAARADTLDWHESVEKARSPVLSAEAQQVLALSAKPRDEVRRLLAGRPNTPALLHNLEVGRQHVLAALYAEALKIANASRPGRAPIPDLLAVNSGSRNFDRDNDVTLFCGHADWEEAIFRALPQAARNLGLATAPRPTGLDLPGIEVSLFRGGYDLPDPRFARDVDCHVLQYRRILEKQVADPEAYKGAAFRIEVLARRGMQAGVQKVSFDPRTGATATGGTPDRIPEFRSLFHGNAEYRAQKWELASHMTSNLLVSEQHASKAGDPTKGPLKYLTRTLDDLARFHRMGKPFSELAPDDRRIVLERVVPGLPGRTMDRLLEVAEQAFETRTGDKQLPAALRDPTALANAERIAEVVMRRSVEATVAEMARVALDPPEMDWRTYPMNAEEWSRFKAMGFRERIAYYGSRNDVFRRATSREAMEDLLMTLTELRTLDHVNGRAKIRQPGQRVIERVLEAAPPRLRVLVELAADYAFVASAMRRATSAELQGRQAQRLYDIRRRMAAEMGVELTEGEEILQRASRLAAADYVARAVNGRPDPLREAVEELNAKFRQRIAEVFPSTADVYRAFRAELEADGAKSWAKRRLAEEAFQLGNVVDALTLVEMAQTGATAKDYAWFLAVNVLSRFHWSASHFIAAFQVRTPEALKDLGKNLFFVTAARLVPGAGTAKVVFDIGRGVVTVTAGYVIAGKNADTIDQLYTGPVVTGPVDRPRVREGTVANALREGFSVLNEGQFVVSDASGVKEIVVDPAAVYRDCFAAFTGVSPYDLPRDPAALARAPEFVAAHDALVRLVVAQAASRGPLWVKSQLVRPSAWFPEPDAAEMEKAISAFLAALEKPCDEAVGRVLDQGAVREYRTVFDRDDTIRSGLRARLVSDFFAGFMAGWETRLTEQALAKREIETAAGNADVAGLGRRLEEEAFRDEKVRPRDLVLVVRVLAAGAEGGEAIAADFAEDSTAAYPVVADGGKPVHFLTRIAGVGDAGTLGDVTVTTEAGAVRVVRRADGSDPSGAGPGPGDVVESETVFLARDGEGAEIGRRRVRLAVRLPAPDAGEPGELVLKTFAGTGPTGDYEEFTYVEMGWKETSARGWPRNSSYPGVLHGDHLRRYSKAEYGTAAGETDVTGYRFGTRHGASRRTFPDGQVRWIRHYEMGVPAGKWVENDPTSIFPRIETSWADGLMTKVVRFGKGDVAVDTFTLEGRRERVEETEQERVTYEGELEENWDDGKPQRKGRIRLVAREIDAVFSTEGLGGASWNLLNLGEQVSWHPNGQVRSRIHFTDGRYDGPYRAWHANGNLHYEGVLSKHVPRGTWKFYFEDGRLQASGSFDEEFRPTGVWTFGSGEDSTTMDVGKEDPATLQRVFFGIWIGR